MPPDPASQSQTPPPDLKLAAESPWYVLATIYGEADEERSMQENAAIHAKNRRIWNGWACSHLSTAQRAELVESAEIDEASLAPLTTEEAAKVQQAFIERRVALPASSAEVDFRTLAFDKPLNMTGFIIGNSLNFSGSHFHSYCTFSGAIFNNDVTFASNEFHGNVSFDGARFRKNALLRDAKFLRSVYFGDAEINKKILLERVSFISELTFRYATLNRSAEISFVGCNFFGSLSEFHRFTGQGVVKFVSCHFEKITSFDEAGFTGLDLLESSFNGPTILSGCHIHNLSVRDCNFENKTIASPVPRGEITIPTTLDEVVFERTTFNSDVDFDEVSFSSRTFFRRTNFNGFSSFRGSVFDNEVSFTDCHFDRPVSFRRAHFKCRFPNFSGAILHPITVFSGQDTLWPEVEWISDDHAEESRESLAIIRHAVGKQGRPEDEHYFYRREMALAARIGTSEQRLPYWLFGYFSDFGHSIGKPTLWLGGCWLLGLLFYAHWLTVFAPLRAVAPPVLAAAGFSFVQLFGFLGLARPLFGDEFVTALPPLLKFVAGAQTVLGVILLFLLGLALRNQFRLR